MIRNCGSGTVRQVPRKSGAMAFCSQKSVWDGIWRGRVQEE